MKSSKSITIDNEKNINHFNENVNEWYWEMDRNGLYTYSNPAVESLLGFNPEEIVGNKYLYDFVVSEERSKFKEEMLKKIANMEPFRNYIIKSIKKDGGILRLFINGIPIINDNGNLIGYSGSNRVITECIDNKENTTDNTSDFLTSMGDCVLFFNSNAELVDSYNFATGNIFSDKDNLDKNKLFDMISPQTNKLFEQAIRKNRKGIVAEYEYSIETGKEIRWFSVKLSPKFDANIYTGSVVVLRDITKNKKSMEVLRESEQMYRALLKTSPDAVSLMDLQGNLIEVSMKSVELHGYSKAEDLIGKNISQLVAPEERERAIEMYGQIVNGVDFDMFEFKLLKADGTKIIGEIRVSVIKNVFGSPQSVISTVRDITQRKNIEKENRHRAEDLSLINRINCAVNRGDNVTSIANLLSNEAKRILPIDYGINLFLLSDAGKYIILQNKSLPVEKNKEIVDLLGMDIPQIKIILKENGYYTKCIKSNTPQHYKDKKIIDNLMMEMAETVFYKDKEKRNRIRKMLPEISSILNRESVVLLPLYSEGEPVGLLEVFCLKGFSGTDLERLKNIASQVIIAVRRMKFKEALMESEAKYSLLVERANDAVVIVQDGIWVFGNKATEKLLGYNVEEMKGKPFTDIIADESKEITLERYKARLRGDNPPSIYDVKIVRGDGETRDVEVSTAAIQYHGRPASIAVMRDITDRKRVQEELKISEERYRSVVEDQTELICRYKPGGKLTFVNKAYCRYFNKSQEELLNSEFLPLITADDLIAVENAVKSISKETPAVIIKHKIVKPNGEIAWQQWTNRANFDDNGNIIEYQAVGRDITDSMKKDSELLQAQKLSSIGQMAAGVAHEINNPLSALSGEIQWLLEKTNEKKLRKSLEFMMHVSDRIENIVNNLLEFSRSSASNLMENHKIGIIIGETLLITEKRLNRLKIIIKRNYIKNLYQVNVNKGEIEQVFVNILLNAADAMPDGGKITIRTKVNKDKDMVEITFKDTGWGIEKENLLKVFDPFYTTKDIHKGTGLGLSVSHGIIKKHGGTISINSRVKKGTEVTITLPLVISKGKFKENKKNKGDL